MKLKKLLLSIGILFVAVFSIIVYSIVSSIAQKPTITEGEFPFSITYEINGETVTINDVYRAHYVGNEGYADTKSRVYVGEIGDLGEGNTVYTLKNEKNTRVELWTNFYPDYMMGDSEYDYFDYEAFEPQILYYDADEIGYSDEETLLSQGIKLISFKYPTPLENSFVFSHISYFSGEIVLPTLFIALLAMGAIIIFVKKEAELKSNQIYTVSIILNYIIGFGLVPFVTIAGLLIDINGGGPELFRQILYFFSSFSVLCVAASVALRRKGYGRCSLVAQLISPASFATYLFICGMLGLL